MKKSIPIIFAGFALSAALGLTWVAIQDTMKNSAQKPAESILTQTGDAPSQAGMPPELLRLPRYVPVKDKFSERAETVFSEALDQRLADGILDAQDYKYLKDYQKALTPNQNEQYFAHKFLSFMGEHKSLTRVTYSFRRESEFKKYQFLFAPTYAENRAIEGDSVDSVLSHISQHDNLDETTEDGNRCGAATLLNAYYYLYRDFHGALAVLGIDSEYTVSVTYKELHLAQEVLYNYSNYDNKDGLLTGNQIKHYPGGKIFEVAVQGEILRGSNLLKLDLHPLVGSTIQTSHLREAAVRSFFKKHRRGVLMVGVNLNPKTGEMLAPSDQVEQNHIVLVFPKQESYYLINSGVTDNGNGKALRRLSDQELEAFVFRSSGIVQGVTRRARRS